ncbi:MAG: IclR family transcriptional regulator [Burkholderiales bacterium]|nr:IclR family transcriptional regulator [Burkholderiales bacterium]
MSEDNKYAVPGLERGLRILMEFSKQEPVLNGAELSRRLDVPRSTVFRLLQTLESLGFIERAASGDRNYRLGVSVLRLGFEYLNSLELTDLGNPIIEKLRDATGYSSHIIILDRQDAVFVAKAASRDPVFSAVSIGTRLPAHATVIGQVLLGDCDLAALHKLYPQGPLKRYTDHTPETIEALFARVQEYAARGYATSQSFFEYGISTVVAPVRDHRNKIVAAISVTVPRPQLEDRAQDNDLVSQVVAAANELSYKLNYRQAPA